MEQTPEPRRRLNVMGKAQRRKRIFARLREGWAYDEIAREERVSPERIRQIVSEVLSKRVIDRGVDHAHLQLERLMPALRVVGEAIGRGELTAVAPLIKVIDRLDKHQDTVVAKYDYGPEERQRLLDKVNRLVDNLQPLELVRPSIWIVLAHCCFAAKAGVNEGWKSLDFFGFSRPNRAFSMA